MVCISGHVEEIFRRFASANPEPQGELHYRNAYTLLVAVVLSAQASDQGVNAATKDLFSKVDDPQKMLKLGQKTLRHHIRSIGLFNTKARHIIALSQILVDDYQGQVPDNRQALESLPGVGRKTANVVLNIFFRQPVMAVDTHLFRLSNRIPLAPGKTVRAVEDGLMQVVPDWALLHAHHWLILHGRYICRARQPLCQECLIYDLCRWPLKPMLDGNGGSS